MPGVGCGPALQLEQLEGLLAQGQRLLLDAILEHRGEVASLLEENNRLHVELRKRGPSYSFVEAHSEPKRAEASVAEASCSLDAAGVVISPGDIRVEAAVGKAAGSGDAAQSDASCDVKTPAQGGGNGVSRNDGGASGRKASTSSVVSDATRPSPIRLSRFSLVRQPRTPPPYPWMAALQGWISWWPFELFIAMVIIANSVTIGIESSLSVAGEPMPAVLHAVEVTFLCVYILELTLRISAGGLCLLSDSRWITFDAVLVCWGIADFVIAISRVRHGFGDNMSLIMLVRVLRVGRLARLIRFMTNAPRSLWLLVNGLYHSLSVLIWTMLTASVVTYIFAVAGIEFIRGERESAQFYDQVARENFGTLSRAMLTLLQAFTLDSIGAVYRPLILANPPVLFFFLLYIFIASIALMNLVTAVIVDTSIQQASQDREHRSEEKRRAREALIEKLRDVFNGFDIDGSGMVSFAEVRNAPAEVQRQLQEMVQMNDMEELFEYLDNDSSGQVGVDEFCNGILKSQNGTPIELLCIMNHCRGLQRASFHILNELGKLTSITLPLESSRAPVDGNRTYV